MKSAQFLVACIVISVSVLSCKKGDQGPQGEAGNANVIVYNFGSKTSAGGSIAYQIVNISQGKADLTGGRTKPSVDYDDYNAVCKYYNISE